MPKSTTQTPTTAPAAPNTAPLAAGLLARENSIAKLSKRGRGTLVYQVLLDPGRQHAYLRISANTGGGYFSREAVPVSAIRDCLAQQPEDQPLRSSAFKPAFTNRSNNNAGFLAAALVAEGLLDRDPDQPHLLTRRGQIDDWERTLLGISGGLAVIPVSPAKAITVTEAEAIEQPDPATEDTTRKPRRKAKQPEVVDEPPVP